MISKSLFAAAMIFATSAAQAADMEEPAAFDWSGPYIGVNAGYGWSKTDQSFRIPEDSSLDLSFQELLRGLRLDSLDDGGFTGGLTIGWNHQFDMIVLGVEGDIGFLDIGASSQDSVDGFTQGRIRDRLEGDMLATLRLRAGLAFDQTLFYVTGGAAYTDAKVKRDVDYNLVFECPRPGGDFFRCHSGDKDFDIGWTVGAGIEHALDQNWSIKVEYLYADFGRESFTTVNPDDAGDRMKHSFDLDLHIVRAGVNYRF